MRDFQDNHAAHADKTLIKRLLKYLKPHRGEFIGAFFMMFITIFTNLVLPLATGWSIDYMTRTDVTNDQKMLALAVATLIGLVILMISVVVGFFQQRILQEIGQDVTHVMRKEVFEHIENLSIGQINLLPVGKLVTRATNDPGNISDMFTNTIVNLLRNVLMMIVIAVVLLILNWQMALLTFLTLPLILLASSIFRKYSRTAYRNVRTNISELNGYLSENLSGMKITQIFNQEEKKVQNFKVLNDKLKKSYYREINTFGIYRPIIWLISMIATILTVYFGVTTVIDGALSVGLFISFYIYVGQFFEPIQQISEQFNALQNGFSSAEKIFDVLDTKPDIVDDVDAINLKKFDGQIEFKNVWFSYIEGEWILKDVSFKVNPNETVAFVGATGSGKTTILQLIVRNYDIQKGQILIDGIDIKTIKRSSLRKFVGQMLQDVFLFSGTIRDNITLGNPDITDEDIKRASNYVGLDYILNKLPDGLDHVVKERGNNFSSGERQLISFARAVVYNPSLMILDEATANIDSETETIIQESLNKMMNISTMLIVAHRLSTIQHSDRIIVMSKGEIVESGKHQELLKQNGLYYNLYQLQYDKKEGETHV
ncbi:ABC transporter ATP-binding protein [Acholeplasma laidlawii]|uniref:ABC transporter ATP-binding protein n=1 Tax=Acholeplasma laidlawii TaxID=2148 RepID=UPI0018C2F961|nr:ABC transporter ATP-binding protein [Acholeplasma laidlawii]MBG0763152.1 ABC transporter ATP-binding protein [Acholeplasma laidlawii]